MGTGTFEVRDEGDRLLGYWRGDHVSQRLSRGAMIDIENSAGVRCGRCRVTHIISVFWGADVGHEPATVSILAEPIEEVDG